jgi:hypothetical protein
MPKFRVVIASYATEIVDAANEQDACDIAMEIFEPSNEWHIADVEIDNDFNPLEFKENENA